MEAALLSSLLLITLAAEHLQILPDRLAALAPWQYMVAVHIGKIKLLSTTLAFVSLRLIRLELHIVGECAQAQRSFVASQYVGYDA